VLHCFRDEQGRTLLNDQREIHLFLEEEMQRSQRRS
jgi:hypothetical protein